MSSETGVLAPQVARLVLHIRLRTIGSTAGQVATRSAALGGASRSSAPSAGDVDTHEETE